MRSGAAAIISLLLVAACSGGGSGGSADTTGPVLATIELTADVHYAGFRLDLDTVTHRTGQVVVTGSAENLGAVSAAPPLNATIDLGDETAAINLGASRLPAAPPGGVVPVIYAFNVPAPTDLTEAVLAIGADVYARALVPLGGEGEVVSNRPADIDPPGSLPVAGTTVEVGPGERRFDLLDSYAAAPAGKAFVSFSFEVPPTVADPTTLIEQNVALRSPGGAVLVPHGPITGSAAIAGAPVLLTARWMIDAGESGTYALIGYGLGDLDAPAELPFTVVPST